MTILIGNQKGGAGKSTVTLLLANYLTQAKRRTVTIIDFDYQQSIAQKYERAKLLENTEPYTVVAASLDHFPGMKEILSSDPAQIILVDLPGKLDDDGLIAIFEAADLVICPFAYDEFSFESTILFSVVLHKINSRVPIVYIPNRVKANVKYETQRDVDEQLAKLGTVTSPLPDRIDFQRVSTFATPPAILPAVLNAFDTIYKQYLYE
ncbi:ParA family protein [Mucilaginibacter corticis]|uniref:ParA family protein n=1 Tax=Mucilaginibacter corticis TaxID=2597670 RepID=A0A556MM64_9SPHI|nr:ParA family protein [Mucilaginibacter corticis]TSJ40955.1 ParA family protein [Mucilaginibacter corticis]